MPEWWTEALIEHVRERGAAGAAPLAVLDLCAGSGAVGVAIAKQCPDATVAFGEIDLAHLATIERNIRENGINPARVRVRRGDLLRPFPHERFDIIAANPPYVPETRELDPSVTAFEPHRALFAGDDGLSVIRRIVKNARHHLMPDGELWLECDIDNAEAATELMAGAGAAYTALRNDIYGRPRLAVGYYP